MSNMQNSINHHINDDTLLGYANATLAGTLSLVVATHLSVCPKCRKQLDLVLSVGSTFLDQADNNDLSSKEMSFLDEIVATPQDAPQAHEEDITAEKLTKAITVPGPLNNFIPCELDEIPWKRLVPGVSHYPLQGIKNGDGKGALRLLKIDPGTTLPEHTHSGQELTLILKGSYIDEVGRFAEGDIADLDDSIHHQPVADTSVECICLIATDAPLKFKGFFSRLLQPIIGI
ncbi:ChrR family anti-sigma-E factor [Sneathiella limimaris]|uniref:ChrR family anti-sigma-E factor n=1 Tax=Sneathiella limimaris TaxID=1964213 RepID=UPI00146BDC4B|nr:ChrR family anti-sigma-E factor [Sneathiella limimaris]